MHGRFYQPRTKTALRGGKNIVISNFFFNKNLGKVKNFQEWVTFRFVLVKGNKTQRAGEHQRAKTLFPINAVEYLPGVYGSILSRVYAALGNGDVVIYSRDPSKIMFLSLDLIELNTSLVTCIYSFIISFSNSDLVESHC